MRDALVQLYVHFVWGTWDRLPLITTQNEKLIYEAIISKCKQLGSAVIAIGGMSDHIHLFVRFPATVSIADFIKEVKGSTSHLINHVESPDGFFKWQGSYAVFSVSEGHASKIKNYIQYQKEHHDNHQMIQTLEL